MTNQDLRDPEKNYAYYAHNQGYKPDAARHREHRVQWAAERLRHGLLTGMHVLDLGCNDAFMAAYVPDDVFYTGIELNKHAIGAAQKRPNMNLRLGNVMDPVWQDRQWDRILILETLEHVPDPDLLLRTALAHLVPGTGRLITTSAMNPGAHDEHEPGNNEHLREWNLDGFVKMHTAAGAEVLEDGAAQVYPGRFTNCVFAKRAGT
jgi:2-polyprenyl-3-methyl-5-hydroxy-6-metoxy-1,4-benzoquinol methylase